MTNAMHLLTNGFNYLLIVNKASTVALGLNPLC